MQCNTCHLELGEQAHCDDCDRQDAASAKATNIVGGDAGSELADGSNVLPAPEAPPQAADSSEYFSEQPTGETPTSNSIDSKGDQSIIEKAQQTIEAFYQTELGGDVRPQGDFKIGTHAIDTSPKNWSSLSVRISARRQPIKVKGGL